MTSPPLPVPDDGRFGQLTYSSFDRGNGPGGWQVKQTQGLAPEEVEQLTSRIATRADADDVDRFPTPEEIAALPRRLVYGPTGKGPWAYWHTAPAGVDGSGRPGNVFAHVVLDRRPGTVQDDLRPADLWRSEDWLVPFNPEQVLAAALTSGPRPRRRADATTAHSLSFLLDPDVWRLGLLPGLLDAVAAALAGGPAVVLGVESVDRGADWIAAVSRLTSSAVARRLSFSTLERADTVGGTVASGVRLLCVPRDDLNRLEPSPGVVVLDEDEVVQVGALGGEPHVTERGAQIRVTPWSTLAVTALDEEGRTKTLLADMERISYRTGDGGAPAGWPLAVATLAHPELQEGREEAGVAVLEFAPAHLSDDELAAVVARGVGYALGRTAADAWHRTVELHAAPTSATAVLVRDVYLGRAFADRAWLTRREPAPYAGPDVPLPAEGVRAALHAQLLVLRAEAVAGADPLATAVACLRLGDLAVRARLAFPPPGKNVLRDAEVEELLQDETERTAVPFLFDGSSVDGLLDRVGPVDPRTREVLLVPLISQRMSATGQRLPRATSGWLLPHGVPDEERLVRICRFEGLDDPFETQQVLDAQARLGVDGGRLLARAALVLVLHARVRASAPAGDAAVRRTAPPGRPALEGGLEPVPEASALDAVPGEPARTYDADALTELAVRADLDADAALRLLEQFPGTPSVVLVGVLKSAPQTSDMDALCARSARPWAEGLSGAGIVGEGKAQRLVRLRSACHHRVWTSALGGGHVVRGAGQVERAVLAALRTLPEVPLDPTLFAHGQAAWVVSGLSRHWSSASTVSPLVANEITVPVLSGAPAGEMVDALRRTVHLNMLAVYAVMSAPASSFSAPAGLEALAGLRVQVDGVERPVLDVVLQEALQEELQQGDRDRNAVVDDVVQSGVQVLRRLGAVDKATMTTWKDLVGTHVRSLAPRQGVFGGRFRRG